MTFLLLFLYSFFCYSLTPLYLWAQQTGLDSLQNIKPKNAIYYYEQGQQALKNKDYHQAVTAYSQALEKNPQHIPSYMGAAKSYSALGLLKQARGCYKNILRYIPNNSAAHTGLAEVLIHSGDMKRAYTLLEKVRRKEPANTNNNYVLGLWHSYNGKTKLAQLYLQKVIDIEPSHVASLIEMARLSIIEDRLIRTKEYLKQASAVNPVHPGIYQIRGYLNIQNATRQKEKSQRLKLLDRAYSAFLTAHKLSPQDIRISEELLRIDIYRGKTESAKALVSKLLAQLPQKPYLYYLSGLLQLQANSNSDQQTKSNSPTAIEQLHKGLTLDRKNAFIRHTLESLMMDHPNIRPNQNHLIRLELAKYHLKEMSYYKKQYLHKQMSNHLRRALYLYPLQIEALRHQLKIYKKNGDYEGLLAVYKQLHDINPRNIKLHYRMDKTQRQRKTNIAYRERLFNPYFSSNKPTFKRSSPNIFVFSITSEQPFPKYPDAGEQIARNINWELSQPGPIQSPKNQRNQFIHYMHSNSLVDPIDNPWGLNYHPKHIHHLHDRFTEETKIDYLLSGTYHIFTNGSIRARFDLRESNTGTRLKQFILKSSTPNTLLNLAAKLRHKLIEYVPIEGEVIKINNKDIFVNLGSYDGISIKKSRFLLLDATSSTKKSILKAQEVGAYVSRLKRNKANQENRISLGTRLRLLQ